MTRPGNRPRRPILFAAVTGEEKGELGSQYLARHPVVGNGHVIGVVNLDMPVLTYDFQDVIAFGAEHSTMGAVVAARRGADGRRALARSAAAGGPVHPLRPLQVRAAGHPGVFLMTGFANGGREQFTDFLAHHYHSPSDDLQPADQLAGGRPLRPAELSDRARDRRRGGRRRAGIRAASSATPSAATSRGRRSLRRWRRGALNAPLPVREGPGVGGRSGARCPGSALDAAMRYAHPPLAPPLQGGESQAASRFSAKSR